MPMILNWTFQLTVKFRSRCCSPSAWSAVRPLGNRASPLRHQAERDRNPNAGGRAIPPHGGRLQIGAGLAQVHNLHPDLLNLFFTNFVHFCTCNRLQVVNSDFSSIFVLSNFPFFKNSIFLYFLHKLRLIFLYKAKGSGQNWLRIDIQRRATL